MFATIKAFHVGATRAVDFARADQTAGRLAQPRILAGFRIAAGQCTITAPLTLEESE
jgi:hypothetical protein